VDSRRFLSTISAESRKDKKSQNDSIKILPSGNNRYISNFDSPERKLVALDKNHRSTVNLTYERLHKESDKSKRQSSMSQDDNLLKPMSITALDHLETDL